MPGQGVRSAAFAEAAAPMGEALWGPVRITPLRP